MVETKGQRRAEGRQQIRWWKLKDKRRAEGRQKIRWWKLKDRGKQKVDNRSDGGK